MLLSKLLSAPTGTDPAWDPRQDPHQDHPPPPSNGLEKYEPSDGAATLRSRALAHRSTPQPGFTATSTMSPPGHEAWGKDDPVPDNAVSCLVYGGHDGIPLAQFPDLEAKRSVIRECDTASAIWFEILSAGVQDGVFPTRRRVLSIRDRGDQLFRPNANARSGSGR